MSQFNRRGFMRTLLVTAVGAVPAHVAVTSNTAWPSLDSGFPPPPRIWNTAPSSFASPNRLTPRFPEFPANQQ